MNWALAIVCLLVGLGLGYLVGKRNQHKGNQDKLEQELAQARFELEQQHQGIADYFERSKSQMAALRGEMDKAQRLWQESAQELTSEAPVEAEPEQEEISNVTSLPPNDYVQGSHGIINQTSKVANQ
ncbi:DUF1043 family protein [uncultured Ferrimonas sp.]|uniref:ZapG family protein n=1 Tax=uncultured Ferrimonas sp. TaxID=432640 RepID=UPI002610DAAF|nr:DUF1043 family protein [uncultured Ferrimonas sp.]